MSNEWWKDESWMSERGKKRKQQEKPGIETMVLAQKTPDKLLVVIDTAEHRAAVVKIINIALGWANESYALGVQVAHGRYAVSQMRGSGLPGRGRGEMPLVASPASSRKSMNVANCWP